MSLSTKYNNFLSTNGRDNYDFGSKTSSNYYGSKPKDPLAYLSQNKDSLFSNGGGTLFNPGKTSVGFIDPFKELENQKALSLNGGASSFNSLSPTLGISNIDTRKMIEMEMAPYLSQMKTDLNLMFEKFKKEIDSKNESLNEVLSMKDQNDQQIKLNTVNQNKNEEKFVKLFHGQNTLNNKLLDFQNEINDLKLNYQLLSQKNDQIIDKVSDFSRNKEKNSSGDENEKMFREISNNVEKLSMNKLSLFNAQMKILKKENDELRSILNKINVDIDTIKYENQNKEKEFKNIIEGYEDQLNKINDLNFETKKALNIIEGENNRKSDINNNFRLLSNKINKTNENYQSLQIGLSNMKDLIVNFNKNSSDLENELNKLKIETKNFDSKLKIVESNVQGQKDKYSSIKQQISDMVDQQTKTLYTDLSSQVATCKLQVENSTDENNANFEGIKKKFEAIDEIITKNPFLQMNEKEKITQDFKEKQNQYNENLQNVINALNKSLSDLRRQFSDIQIDRNNFEKIKKNFNVINQGLEKINSLEKTAKEYPKIIESLSKNHLDLKSQIENEIEKNYNWQLEMQSTTESLKTQIKNLQNNSNRGGGVNEAIKFQDGIKLGGGQAEMQMVQDIKLDLNKLKLKVESNEKKIKEINERKFHEVYNYINNIIMGTDGKTGIISNNKSHLYFNPNADSEKNVDSKKEEIINNDDNEIDKKNNNDYYINNNDYYNYNNNKNNDYNYMKNNNDDNNNYNNMKKNSDDNDNNKFNVSGINSQNNNNIDDLVKRIEAMGGNSGGNAANSNDNNMDIPKNEDSGSKIDYNNNSIRENIPSKNGSGLEDMLNKIIEGDEPVKKKETKEVDNNNFVDDFDD